MTIEFELDGSIVHVDDAGGSLLDVLRNDLGIRSIKDGCSPQGQCGCCTVLVDGAPRVACVTPVQRIAGRSVTTVEGVDDRGEWAAAFCNAGASQCGFCTPGIIVRLAALSPADQQRPAAVRKALLAHLCRCTGWNSVVEASVTRVALTAAGAPQRSIESAERRSALEGGVAQRVDPDVALGRGGFADDLAPPDALIAMVTDDGEWVVADTMLAARTAAHKTPGRRTTTPVTWPIEVPSPPGLDWERTLQTTWVEPAYLEPDAAWCLPGGVPASPLGNGGAFGGKARSEIGDVARRLADEHGRPVRAMWTREDVVRLGFKRPPVAIGINSDGSGLVRLARPADPVDEELLRVRIAAVAPHLSVDFVDVVGPRVAAELRASGWAEVAAVVSSLGPGPDTVAAPNGAVASARWIDAVVAEPGSQPARADLIQVGSETEMSDGTQAHSEARDETQTLALNETHVGDELQITVQCGRVLDEVVLRSYCVGAAHMALGFVTSEKLAVSEDGVPLDLTIRSFGVVRAVDTPVISVVITPSDDEPVNGSDAVFAAVAAATWRRHGFAPQWPTRI